MPPDGEALLTPVGRTGPVGVAIGHVRPGAPFRYSECQVRCASRLRHAQRAPRLHADVHEVLIGFARP
jgi:hypothetical protein